MRIEIPGRLLALLTRACAVVDDDAWRGELTTVATTIASVVWQRYLCRRPPQDNRVEHEFIVLGNVLRIARDEQLGVSDLRVAVAFSFLHDTHFIPRITEWAIRAEQRRAEEEADPAVAQQWRQRVAEMIDGKKTQRQRHMAGGAANARQLLSDKTMLGAGGRLPLTDAEIERCAELIAHHDDWKLGVAFPPTEDRLALACVEGDALWPLHPLGILADLERPDEDDQIRDVSDPLEWQRQVRESVETLCVYRGNWPADAPGFVDERTFFRTVAGWRQYDAWRRYYGWD